MLIKGGIAVALSLVALKKLVVDAPRWNNLREIMDSDYCPAWLANALQDGLYGLWCFGDTVFTLEGHRAMAYLADIVRTLDSPNMVFLAAGGGKSSVLMHQRVIESLLAHSPAEPGEQYGNPEGRRLPNLVVTDLVTNNSGWKEICKGCVRIPPFTKHRSVSGPDDAVPTCYSVYFPHSVDMSAVNMQQILTSSLPVPLSSGDDQMDSAHQVLVNQGSLHHLSPSLLTAALKNAVDSGDAFVAIDVCRSVPALLVINTFSSICIAVGSFLVKPTLFRFLTMPIVYVASAHDGFKSGLRLYSQTEFRDLAQKAIPEDGSYRIETYEQHTLSVFAIVPRPKAK